MLYDVAQDITAVGVAVSSVLAGIAAVIAALNRRSIRTNSGDPIGHVTERTHDLVSANELRRQQEADGRTEA